MSYKSVRIMDGVYHISDPLGVYSTLIVGSRRALLVDTGSGLGDLRGVVEGLTDRPLTVVNTHGHVDHISGDYQFTLDRVFEADFSAALLNSGPYPGGGCWSSPRKSPRASTPAPTLSYGLANAVAMAPGARFELGRSDGAVRPAPEPHPGFHRLHLPGAEAAALRRRRRADDLPVLRRVLRAGRAHPHTGKASARQALRRAALRAQRFRYSPKRTWPSSATAPRRPRPRAGATSFHDPIFRDYEGVKYTYVSPDDPTDCAVVVYSRNKTERSNTMGAVEKIKEFQETVTVHAEGRKEIKPPPPRYEPGNDRWKIEKQEFKGQGDRRPLPQGRPRPDQGGDGTPPAPRALRPPTSSTRPSSTPA